MTFNLISSQYTHLQNSGRSVFAFLLRSKKYKNALIVYKKYPHVFHHVFFGFPHMIIFPAILTRRYCTILNSKQYPTTRRILYYFGIIIHWRKLNKKIRLLYTSQNIAQEEHAGIRLKKLIIFRQNPLLQQTKIAEKVQEHPPILHHFVENYRPVCEMLSRIKASKRENLQNNVFLLVTNKKPIRTSPATQAETLYFTDDCRHINTG